MAEKKQDINKLSFEQSIQSLGDIVQSIEGGETTLQSSLEQYEEGMTLIKHCRDILQQAEKRIEKITAQSDKSDTAKDDNETQEQEAEESEAEDGLF